jgi:two-component system, chemotaxis family, chemotaxis protein CheY
MQLVDVLVVEDEQLLLTAIVNKLTLEKISVIGCQTGEEAWKNLEVKQTLPKVIWLDYYLPDTNGLEIIKKLKSDNRWNKIPVIVVSNSASLDGVEEMKQQGIEKFFIKSDSRLDEIIITVKSLI